MPSALAKSDATIGDIATAIAASIGKVLLIIVITPSRETNVAFGRYIKSHKQRLSDGIFRSLCATKSIGVRGCRTGSVKSQVGRKDTGSTRLELARGCTSLLTPCARKPGVCGGLDRAQVGGRSQRRYALDLQIEIRGYLTRDAVVPGPGRVLAPDNNHPIVVTCRQRLSRRIPGTLPRLPNAVTAAPLRGARSSRPCPRRSGTRSGRDARSAIRRHPTSPASRSRCPSARG